MVRVLLNSRANVSLATSSDHTSLVHIALTTGYSRYAILRMLLDAAADVKASNDRGEQPLHLAAQQVEAVLGCQLVLSLWHRYQTAIHRHILLMLAE